MSRWSAGSRVAILPQVLAPTLRIVSEMDLTVIGLNQRAYERLKNYRMLEIVTGATHLFEEPGALETVADLATQWFARYLASKETQSTASSSAKP
jgi:hypothetical protein